MKRLYAGILFAVLLTVCCGAQEAQPPMLSGQEAFVALPDGPPSAAECVDGVLLEPVQPGSTVYFPILNAARAEDLADMRAMTGDLNAAGEDYLDEPGIEYRMMYDETGKSELGYRYVISIDIRQIPEGSVQQIEGRIGIGRRWGQSERICFSLTVRPEDYLQSGDSILCRGERIPLEFSLAEGVMTLLFSDAARYEVEIEGQGTVDVGFSQNVLTDIEAQYPQAELRFICWTRTPIFNHVGELFLYTGPDKFLYEITPLGVEYIDAAYSPQDEAYRLTTRRLGKYMLSDRLLGEPAENSGAHNPPTGTVP